MGQTKINGECVPVKKGYVRSRSFDNYKVNIPLVKEKKKQFCSEASAEMILNYYGYNTSPLFQHLLDRSGCKSMEDMDKCLSPLLKCRLEKGNFDKLRINLKRKKPTMLRIVPTGQKELHSVVLTSLDEKEITVNDPSIGKIRYNKESFEKMWSKTDNLMLTCKKTK